MRAFSLLLIAMVAHSAMAALEKGLRSHLTSLGYKAKEYPITTDDGYILKMIRFGRTKGGDEKGLKRPLVVIQHGMTSRAEDWITRFKGAEALPLQLLDQGFDVWLGNTRGNSSGSHKNLDREEDSDQYWDFSFAEMGLKDLAKMLDHARDVTGQAKLTYIGFSRGSTQMFYALAHQSDIYKDVLDRFIALAPCTKVAPWLTEDQLQTLTDSKLPYLDSQVLDTLPDDMAADLKPIVDLVGIQSISEAVSTKDLIHFAQIGLADAFQEFSYNFDSNRGRHTQPIPLQDIHGVPVYMLVAEDDEVCDLNQAKWTRDQLSADTVAEFITYPNYSHMSFFLDTGYYWDLFRIVKPSLPAPQPQEQVQEQVHEDL